VKSHAIALLAASSLSLTAGVLGTKHDLSATGPGPAKTTNINQTCVFCHTPHNAAVASAQIIPLWNKVTTANTGFTMYNQINNPNSNIQGVVDPTPAAASMICFTCHDGTQAIGNMINMPSGVTSVTYAAASTAMDANGKILGTSLLGKDLTKDHPISITYPDTDTGLVSKASILTLTNSVKLFGTPGAEKVECSSCHDVHNNTNPPFLRVTMANSALCVVCHLK
jgi:predicted CXXCH cytochrome family protein